MILKIKESWEVLNQSLNEIEKRLMTDEGRAMLSQGEAWSAYETLVHLFLTEMLALKYIKYKELKATQPPQRSRFHAFRNWLLTMYLRSSRKRISPDIVDPRRYKGKDIDTLTALFSRYREVRGELSAILESKDEAWLSSGIFKHPIIGRIDALGMLKFFEEHFQRHTKQIERSMGQDA